MRAIKFGIGLIIALAGSAAAQSVVTAQNTQTSSSVRNVTFTFDNTPLSVALDELAQKSGTKITYSGDLVLNKQVSARGTNVNLRIALVQILTGTRLGVVEEGSQLVIIQNTRKSGNVAQGIITGRVTDAKTGKGISGANLSVDGDARGVVSGEDGSYRLAGISSGVHIVVVRLVGYAKQTRTVSIGDAATVTVDFKLEPSASVLDQVVVTGTMVQSELRSVPNAITVITAKQIEERGITRIDQLFRGDVPGLFAQNVGSSNALDSVSMFARGATRFKPANGPASNPIKTYLDGIELANPQYLSQIDPKSIERIEILTGPQASTIYGSNAINGVMQIFTKRGTTSKPLISMTLTSGFVENNFREALTPIHEYDSGVSGTEGKWSYNLGGSWNFIGAWTPAKQTTRINMYGAGKLMFNNIIADISLRRSNTRNLQKGGVAQALLASIETGESGYRTFGRTEPRTYNLNSQTLGVTLSFTPRDWWAHELVLGTDVSNTENIATDPSYVSRTDSLLALNQSNGTRTSVRYVTNARFPVNSLIYANLTMGGDAWQSTSNSIRLSPTSLTGALIDGFGSPTLARDKPGRNMGGFIQTQLGISDALFLTYGLRAEWNPNYGDEAQPNLAPRYGFAYTQELGIVTAKLRVSYGRSTRPPSVDQKKAQIATAANSSATLRALYGSMDIVLANLELGPDFQQGGEGGIELYFGNRGSLVITRYNQTVDALIASVPRIDSARSLLPNPSLFTSLDEDGYGYWSQSQNLNVGSIRNQGWELQATSNIGPLTTKGVYSWTKSRIIGITPKYKTLLTGPEYVSGTVFDLLPEHTWAITIGYAKASTNVSLNVNGTGWLYRSQDDLVYEMGFTRLMNNKSRNILPDGYRSIGPKYTTADITATHRFSRNFEALLQVQNLTDFYQNDSDAGAATIGRQTRLGLRMRLQ